MWLSNVLCSIKLTRSIASTTHPSSGFWYIYFGSFKRPCTYRYIWYTDTIDTYKKKSVMYKKCNHRFSSSFQFFHLTPHTHHRHTTSNPHHLHWHHHLYVHNKFRYTTKIIIINMTWPYITIIISNHMLPKAINHHTHDLWWSHACVFA